MALSPLPTEGNTMMAEVVCTCGHSGVVNAETLPRELTCSRCGSSRRVETKEVHVSRTSVPSAASPRRRREGSGASM
jgi:hypothetical protein